MMRMSQQSNGYLTNKLDVQGEVSSTKQWSGRESDPHELKTCYNESLSYYSCFISPISNEKSINEDSIPKYIYTTLIMKIV
jgi:hypothetical protein